MKLPPLKARELEAILRKDGWYQVSQTGSHRHFKHNEKPQKVTIPIHAGDIYADLVAIIIKQAGISRQRFFELR